MYDIISIGDTTVDVFLELDEAEVACDKNHDHCRLSFPYGSKVPVKSIVKINGVGNAANVAVASAKLGHKTALFTLVGNDDRGHDIVHKMKDMKVATTYIRFDHEHHSNYSTILDYHGDRTILAYHEERRYTLPKLGKSRWIYFSSIAGNHEEFNRALIAHVIKHKIKLAFNPGSHQLRLGVEALHNVLAMTSVLFLNKEEAEMFVPKAKSMAELLTGLHALGPIVVAVTDGEHGSYVYDGGTMWQLPVLEAPAVERTGCGDAFASAFLAAIMDNVTIPEAMRWGTANAASVIGRVGSQAGLLTKTEIEKVLSAHTELKPKVM